MSSYKSSNHKHSFRRLMKSDEWWCDGYTVFGKCKSNLNILRDTDVTRYKCNVCDDFYFCQLCLDAPKKSNVVEKKMSLNHEHPFKLIDQDDGWRCDGFRVYGRCKADLDDFHKSYGMKRYRCQVCDDFDFCEMCLDAPKIVAEKTYESKYHEHKFRKSKEYKACLCDGYRIHGKCRSNLGCEKVRYKCTTCFEFYLCESCFGSSKEPLTSVVSKESNNTYDSPNHEHPFRKLNKDNGWKCDGVKVYGKCKSNLDEFHKSYGLTRFQCTVCHDLDFCQLCLDAPKMASSVVDGSVTFMCLNHEHRFRKINKDNGWKCDGVKVYGKCKSNLDDFHQSYGKSRYQCTVCHDFDLCQLCLDAPKIDTSIVEERENRGTRDAITTESTASFKLDEEISKISLAIDETDVDETSK